LGNEEFPVAFSPCHRVTLRIMKHKRIFAAAALTAALALPSSAMAVADLAGLTGNGVIVERERSVGRFSSIEVTGSEELILHRGDSCRVLVTCDENLQDSYRARVTGSRLSLGFAPGTRIGGFTKVVVNVWLPELEGVTLSGSGNALMQDSFDARDVRLVISGSGSIRGALEAHEVDSTISGSGSIRLTGSSRGAKVVISGSGSFDGADLALAEAEVQISGSGSVDLDVSESLEVRISGSGDVRYRGNPRVNLSSSGSGKVISR